MKGATPDAILGFALLVFFFTVTVRLGLAHLLLFIMIRMGYVIVVTSMLNNPQIPLIPPARRYAIRWLKKQPCTEEE